MKTAAGLVLMTLLAVGCSASGASRRVSAPPIPSSTTVDLAATAALSTWWTQNSTSVTDLVSAFDGMVNAAKSYESQSFRVFQAVMDACKRLSDTAKSGFHAPPIPDEGLQDTFSSVALNASSAAADCRGPGLDLQPGLVSIKLIPLRPKLNSVVSSISSRLGVPVLLAIDPDATVSSAPWTTSADSTTCEEWFTQMDQAQRSLMARDLLAQNFAAAGAYNFAPEQGRISDFVLAINALCDGRKSIGISDSIRAISNTATQTDTRFGVRSF